MREIKVPKLNSEFFSPVMIAFLKSNGITLTLFVTALLKFSSFGQSPATVSSDDTYIYPSPPGILEPDWLDSRKAAQLATLSQFDAYIDFQFTDRLKESGIEWTNRVVDDAGYSYKAVHYDHGNGLAVADVDGDGHLDLYFVNQVGSNALFQNRGDGTFVDKTGIAGVGLDDRICVSASFADFDNDALPDLFVTSVKEGNKLYKNLGDWEFKDVTEDSWLNHQGHSSGAVFFDFNRDGWLDLFLTNVGEYTNNEYRTNRPGPSSRNFDEGEHRFFSGHADGFHGHLRPWRAERSILYRNNGDGTFSDVSESLGLIETGWNGDALPFDANGDGWTDLYITDMQGHDEYWENQSGEKFVKKTFSAFGKTPWGAMGVHAFDWNQDGLLDLYITDMHSDMSKDIPPRLEEEKQKSDIQFPESYLRSGGRSLFGNAFYQNKGDGSFEEISQQNGAENYWPWGLSVGDLNADGYEDAFVVSSMNYGFRYHPNTLLINDGGKMLRDAEFILGAEPREGERTAIPWFDLDAQGSSREHPITQEVLEEAPSVTKISVWGALGGRSSAIFDVDGDGDLDIVTNDFHSEPTLLLSDLSNRKASLNFLKIELEGTASNRDGLGSIVKVEVEGKTFTQLFNGKSGYLSQSCIPLYFGLGDATTADSIIVEWPSGTTQRIDGPIASNKKLLIREEAGASMATRSKKSGTATHGSKPSAHHH